MKSIYLLIFCSMSLMCKEDLEIKELFRALITRSPFSQSLLSDQQPLRSVDLHMLSRFLKQLNEYPCLLLSGPLENQSLVKQLFPQAVVQELSLDDLQDGVCNKVQAFIDAHGGYAIVLINCGSLSGILQDSIQNMIPHIGYLSVDRLLTQVYDNSFDMPKLLRLMKRRIRIVCTAALIPVKYEKRKEEYIRSLNRLIDFGYYPYVVESCIKGPGFLDDYSYSVYYSDSNKAYLKNKGINEAISLLKALYAWRFNEDDIILKMTGRYLLQTDELLRLIEDNEHVVAIAKKEDGSRNHAAPIGSTVVTGCFALRYDLFMRMLVSFDYVRMEKEFIDIEYEVGVHLKQLAAYGVNVVYLKKLNLEGNIFYGDGSDEITYW